MRASTASGPPRRSMDTVRESATLTESDFRCLRILWDAAGSRFAGCVVLYGDQAGASNGNELWAVRMRLPSETP